MLNNKNKIKIAIQELSDQNKAILTFYFTSAGKSYYKLVNEDKADVLIFDYDYPGAADALEQAQSTSNKPAIIFSIKEKNLPNTIWLAKPLSSKDITAAATNLEKMLAGETTTSTEKLNNVVVEEASELEFAGAGIAVATKSAESTANTINSSPELIGDFHSMTDSVKTTTLDMELNDKLDVELELIDSHNNADDTVDVDIVDDADLDTPELIDDEGFVDTNSFEMKPPKSSKTPLELDDITPETNPESIETIETIVSDTSEPDNEIDALLASLTLETEDLTSIDDNIPNDPSNDKSDDESFLDNLLLDMESSQATDDKKDIEPDLVDISNLAVPELKPLELEVPELKAEIPQELTLETPDSNTLEFEIPELELNEPDQISEPISDTLEQQALTLEAAPSDSLIFPDTNEDEISKGLTLEEETFADVFEAEESETLKFDLKRESRVSIEIDTDSDESVSDAELKAQANLSKLDALQKKATNSHSEIELESDFVNRSTENTKELDLILLDEVEAETAKKESKPKEENLALDSLSLLTEEPEFADLEKEEEIQKAKLETANIIQELENEDEATFLAEDTDDIALQSLLNEIREEASDNGDGDFNQASSSGSTQGGTYQKTKAEKRWVQLCGERPNIEKQKDFSAISFDNKKHLLDVLLNQIELVKNSEQVFRMKFNDLIIVIDHSKDCIYCSLLLTSDNYSAICFEELDPKDIKTYDLDYSEVRLYHKKIEENPEKAHSIESFIWSTSLLTSKGRLPVNTDVNKKVGLKVWPNLTRVESIPHAISIAAVFSKHPGSLLEIAQWMKLPQRYVFAFYNAALSLDMIETNANKLKQVKLSFDNKGSNEEPTERGLFSRLIKRLKS